MACVQTLFPFVVLVVTNIIIVRRLAASSKKDATNRKDSVTPPSKLTITSDGTLMPSTPIRRPSHKLSFSRIRMPVAVRNAVITTVAIVASYLYCNSLHLILTVLERTKSSLLDDAEDPTKASTFYTLFGDTVSALYMITSTIRILIYCKCNPLIKVHVIRTLKSFCAWKTKKVNRKEASKIQCFGSVDRKSTLVSHESEPVSV